MHKTEKLNIFNLLEKQNSLTNTSFEKKRKLQNSQQFKQKTTLQINSTTLYAKILLYHITIKNSII